MEKSLISVFVVVAVLGIFASSLILADDVSASLSGSGVGAAAAGYYARVSQGGINVSPGDVQEGVAAANRIRSEVQQRIGEYQSEGSQVRVERNVESENGTVTVNITRTVTFPNGTRANYTVQIQTMNRSGKPVMNLNMERERERYNVSVQNGLNLSDQFFGNHSQIVANLSNGRKANVSVMPDQAVSAALERLRIMQHTQNNGTNVSLQLRERVHNNVPQVVYNVGTNQNGRFLGVFKLAMKVNAEVDAENGTVVAVNRPWWAFLVSVPKASPVQNQTQNQTNTTAENGTSNAPMIPVNNTNSS